MRRTSDPSAHPPAPPRHCSSSRKGCERAADTSRKNALDHSRASHPTASHTADQSEPAPAESLVSSQAPDVLTPRCEKSSRDFLMGEPFNRYDRQDSHFVLCESMDHHLGVGMRCLILLSAID